ncbi:MAG: helix-turn-helix domain-containing protein [Paracoccaceae bacterium]
MIGAQRRVSLDAGVMQDDAVENTLGYNTLQDAAVVQVHATEDVQPLSPTNADYTISVDQVREHFRQRGLRKSKDTIQRWCRNGELDCRKQGIFNRYFTSETSLLMLEQKLLPDLIAEQTGPPEKAIQLDAGADVDNHRSVYPDAPADASACSGTQVDTSANTGERSGTKEHANLDAGASTSVSERTDAQVAELRAKANGLEAQLEQAQSTIKFLQEEIVSSRGQRGDVVKIAEQMLGTLETIAVGGRLQKPANSANEPVRYQPHMPDADRV